MNEARLEELRRRAETALSKPAKYGPDVDVTQFSVPPSLTSYEEVLRASSHLLASVGIDLTGRGSAGTYLQVDEEAVEIDVRAPGLRVMNLQQALEEGIVDDYFWRAVPVDADKYTAAAELFGRRQGYVVIAERGAKIETPVQTCLLMSAPGAIQAPHNIVIVEEGAELHVVTGCLTMMERAGLHAGVSEFYVKRGGKLTYTMIHAWDEQTHVRPRTGVVVEEGGQYISHYVNMTPTASLQTDPKVWLVGRGARAHLSSVIVAKGDSVMDVGGTVYLQAPDTSAEIVSRAVTKDRAEMIARSLISAEAPGVRGHIECDGLLLSDQSRILTLPALDAKHSDVQLSHEAAVGKLSEDQIFYLMSRGFSEDEATSMLVRGFMEVRVEGIPDELRRQIEMAISMAAAGL